MTCTGKGLASLQGIISTGGPRCMRDIGTLKYVSHIKRQRMTIKKRLGSIKKDHSQLHIHELVNKKTAYNEVNLYHIFISIAWLAPKLLNTNQIKSNQDTQPVI